MRCLTLYEFELVALLEISTFGDWGVFGDYDVWCFVRLGNLVEAHYLIISGDCIISSCHSFPTLYFVKH
jgi:hypothetical protein